ncbi:MAG: hypothetical protein JXB38_20265 [Anaerolineales bacterium]|nr:hypothetical protein [Anaerolineales bacterium]
MNISNTKLIGIGALFVVIFFFGFWLSRSGKPYNGLLFNLHKLIALGTLIFLGVIVYRTNQAAPLDGLVWAVGILTGLLFLGTMITGGLLDIDKPLPAVLATVHHITPYLTVLSTAVTLFLVFGRKG